MQSTTSSSAIGCGSCNSSQQFQTLMPQHFMKVVKSNNNFNTKIVFVIRDGLIFGDLTSIPFDPLVDPGPYVCFNCWQGGHSHFDCNQPELQCFCQNCGRKNVIMNDCPRCASAYLEFGMQKMESCCCVCREVEQLSPLTLQVQLNHFCDVEPIPFDVEVDVPDEYCITCLEPRHAKSKLCDNPRDDDFCFNCGRRGVRVFSCPRCRYAYPSYVKRRDKILGRITAKAEVTNSSVISAVDKKPSNSSVRSIQNLAKKHPTKTRTAVPGPFNLYFKALRDIVVQSVHDTKTTEPKAKQRVEISKSTDSINGEKSSVSIGIGDEYLSAQDEDEDLDQIIVDEDEKPQLCQPPSEGIREFLNLMDAVKHLPIDVQSSVCLEFVRKQRVLMNKEKEQLADRH